MSRVSRAEQTVDTHVNKHLDDHNEKTHGNWVDGVSGTENSTGFLGLNDASEWDDGDIFDRDGNLTAQEFLAGTGIAVSAAAAGLIARGAVRSNMQLYQSMRGLNAQHAQPLTSLPNGAITKFPTRSLDVMTEGYGFRLGNTNRVRSMANAIRDGDDLLSNKNPIMVMVYDNGAQVFDGKHRLAAARMAGINNVPIQVARVNAPMPAPKTLRQHWDRIRGARLQASKVNQPIQAADEPFSTRTPSQVEEAFNNWMERMSRTKDEQLFASLGVTRGQGQRVPLYQGRAS